MRQWASGEGRAKKLRGIRATQKLRRTTYDDLTFDFFKSQKMDDGRFWAWYWDVDGSKRTIYRYQWVWEQAHGPIPNDMTIHHKNHDCTDDSLDNLEMLTFEAHGKIHGAIRSAAAPYYTCGNCSVRFQAAAKKRAVRFCSQSCWYAYSRGRSRVNESSRAA